MYKRQLASSSVELPPLTRRAGAWKSSRGPRRDAYVGVGRRGSAGLLRARAAFDVRIHMYLHTTKNLARLSRHRAGAVAWVSSRRRRPPGTGGPARPASESSVLDSDDCWRGGRLLPSGLPTVTQSSGPSLPRTYTVINRPLSRVFLSVERAFLNSQRARVARHNPPRVIGKPGSLPSLCLLGGHVLWPRLRLVAAAAAATRRRLSLIHI